MDSDDLDDIRANLERVQEAVARACARAGRSPDDVLLIAVSKTMDARAGQGRPSRRGSPRSARTASRRRKDKIEALGPPVPWHLIGSLQTNKARDAVAALRLDPLGGPARAGPGARPARPRGRARTVDVLVAGQPRRGAAEGRRAARRARSACSTPSPGCRSLRVRGLMAIPPAAPIAEATRPHFRRLRELRDAPGSSTCPWA